MRSAVGAPAVVPSAEGQEFSLVLGGPLFQIMRRARLVDEAFGLLRRRVAAVALLAWAPLLVLSGLQGSVLDGGRLPFLNDVATHLRLLVVVPLLLAAEVVVHRRMAPLIGEFRARRLIRPREMARFADALNDARRLRNSVTAELLLLLLVYAVGVLFDARRYLGLHMDGWYVAGPPGAKQLSPAGLWYLFVSLPVFQFLLCRWYFRLFIWARFLWRVSRLDLDLEALHPDRSGGLGFVGDSLGAFAPLAMAHGVLLTGMMADRIFYAGAKLIGFEVELAAAVFVLLLMFVGPLMAFTLKLGRAKRAGLRGYGSLASGYVRTFDRKWLRGSAPAGEPLIGSADIQSLADLGNSFSVVEEMRVIPVSGRAVMQFVAAILVPIVPLVLTVVPAEKLISGVVGLVL